jgi:hypothetical protein
MVSAGPAQRCEVEAMHGDAGAECRRGYRASRREHRAPAVVLYSELRDASAVERASDGDLRRVGSVADLIDADEGRGVG